MSTPKMPTAKMSMSQVVNISECQLPKSLHAIDSQKVCASVSMMMVSDGASSVFDLTGMPVPWASSVLGVGSGLFFRCAFDCNYLKCCYREKGSWQGVLNGVIVVQNLVLLC